MYIKLLNRYTDPLEWKRFAITFRNLAAQVNQKRKRLRRLMVRVTQR